MTHFRQNSFLPLAISPPVCLPQYSTKQITLVLTFKDSQQKVKVNTDIAALDGAASSASLFDRFIPGEMSPVPMEQG